MVDFENLMDDWIWVNLGNLDNLELEMDNLDNFENFGGFDFVKRMNFPYLDYLTYF